ncbi:MAG TPA: hypothetical protein VII99_08325 [Bacteroidia bacterium]
MSTPKSRIRVGIITVILLSGISFWIINNTRKGTIRKELFDYAVSDTGAITKIFMVSTSGKQVTLTKQSAGNWQVNGKFKARNDAIKNLLECMKDLQVKNPVAKSAVENVSKDLATSSTKVEIYQSGKLVKMYYVGADTQDGLGTFMLLSDIETGQNSTMPFVMFIPGFNGFLSVRYFLDENTWRDKSIFSFFPDQISSIDVRLMKHPDSSFTISLSDKNEISLADGKGKKINVFDTLKVKRYITYYTNIQYESLKNDMRQSLKDSVLAKGPMHIITLTGRDGKIHTVKTFSKPPVDPDKTDEFTGKPLTEDLERLYALINSDKDIAIVQYFTFGKLFPTASYFTHRGEKQPSSARTAKKRDVKK